MDSKAVQTFRLEALAELYEIEDGGEVGFVKGLFEAYEMESEKLIQDIQIAQHTNNLKDLEMKAHSLKSSSKVLGLDELAETCFKLESLARSSQTEASLVDLLLPLREKAIEALREHVYRH